MLKSIAKDILISAMFICIDSAYSAAKEDADLDFIPKTLLDASSKQDKVDKKEETEKYTIRVKADDLLGYADWRNPEDLIVSIPGYNNSDWNNLARLDVRGEFFITPSFNAHFDTLFNVFLRDNEQFVASKDVQFNIKESYVTWSGTPSLFVDAGRINIKNGVALGFNPTDYFKKNAVINFITQDISQLRDNRLGTFAVRAQKLWDSGAVTLVAAPKMGSDPDHWYSDKGIYGLNMQKTNDTSRFMIKLSQRLIGNFSPEFIYYNEAGNSNFGLNLTHSINDNLIAYAEWNVGESRTVLDQALLGFRDSNQLQPALLEYFPQVGKKKYRNQLVVGASYTTTSNITTNLEYHYNQLGLSTSDWNNWFNAGEASNGNPQAMGQLLSVRNLALLSVEPSNQHTLFLRSQWKGAGMNDLDLTGLFIMDIADQSSLVQAEAAYNFNSQSSILLRAAKFNGNNKSNYGSIFTNMMVTLQYVYNF